MRTVALDLGKRITYCEVREQKVIRRKTVRNLGELEDLLGLDTEPANVAVEACIEAWHAHDVLKAWGHAPVLLDTTRVRQLGIGHHKKKTDRLDAEVLAKALERGHAPVAHVLSQPSRDLRHLHGVRRVLVRARATLAIQAKSVARAHGVTLGIARPAKLSGVIERRRLPDELAMLLRPLSLGIAELSGQIEGIDGQLEELATNDHVLQLLTTAPGVGVLTAGAFVSVVDDPRRFKHAHQVQAYLGLVPSEYSSSDSRHVGHITKQGNSYLRALLVQSAWTVLRQRSPRQPLKTWGEQIRARRGARVAVVAIARKLAGALWAMWRHDQPYDAKRAALETAAGISEEAIDRLKLAGRLKETA
jgi:transposase